MLSSYNVLHINPFLNCKLAALSHNFRHLFLYNLGGHLEENQYFFAILFGDIINSIADLAVTDHMIKFEEIEVLEIKLMDCVPVDSKPLSHSG